MGQRARDRREARRNARLERKRLKQEARTTRAGMRQETRQSAYESGQNPNQFVSDLFSSGADVGSSYFDNNPNLRGSNPSQKDLSIGDLSLNTGMNYLPLILGGVGLYMLMSLNK